MIDFVLILAALFLIAYFIYDSYTHTVNLKVISFASHAPTMSAITEIGNAERFIRKHKWVIKSSYRDSALYALSLRRKHLYGT